MKRKPVLRKLLISLAVLIVVAGIAVAWLLFYYVPRFMDTQDKMIFTVRYIGLAQSDAFYDEIMSLPDGYIRASDLKTPLAEANGESPWNRELFNGEMLMLGFSSGMNGPDLLRFFAGHIYVKKEGRFLCAAVIVTAPHPFHPGNIWYARRFELIPDEGDPHGAEEERQDLIKAGALPEDRKVIRTEDWDIDPYELFKHGIQFYPPPDAE